MQNVNDYQMPQRPTFSQANTDTLGQRLQTMTGTSGAVNPLEEAYSAMTNPNILAPSTPDVQQVGNAVVNGPNPYVAESFRHLFNEDQLYDILKDYEGAGGGGSDDESGGFLGGLLGNLFGGFGGDNSGTGSNGGEDWWSGQDWWKERAGEDPSSGGGGDNGGGSSGNSDWLSGLLGGGLFGGGFGGRPRAERPPLNNPFGTYGMRR